jgi:hypothetical protein
MSEIIARVVGTKAAKKALKTAFKVKRPVFLWGPPGIGKSESIDQLGNDMESLVIDIRLALWEPSDIKGIPYFNPEKHVMEWAPPVELPNEELASNHKNIILFLDEMNSAAPSVQAAAYQLILNRKIGTYSLPDNVLIVAAGNRDTDRGVTNRMPKPLANRFTHLELKVDWDDYFEWATNNHIHPDVLGFLTFSKKDLYDFDPKLDTRAFATPRSWTYVSDYLYNENDEDVLLDLISGTVGEGLAAKLMAHRKFASKLPNPIDILKGGVTTLATKEISAMYSLIIGMCYELKENVGVEDSIWNSYTNNFLKYSMANFETEIIIMAMRLAMQQYKLMFDIDEIECFDEFRKKYGKYISASTAV